MKKLKDWNNYKIEVEIQVKKELNLPKINDSKINKLLFRLLESSEHNIFLGLITKHKIKQLNFITT